MRSALISDFFEEIDRRWRWPHAEHGPQYNRLDELNQALTHSATGPFGEVAHAVDQTATLVALGEGDAFNAAICSELARAGHTDEDGGQARR